MTVTVAPCTQNSAPDATSDPRNKPGRWLPRKPEINAPQRPDETVAIVASMVGVEDPGQVRKWRNGALVPTVAALEKLRFMLTQAWAIEDAESVPVAPSWLTSANSRLDYQLPITAIAKYSTATLQMLGRPTYTGIPDECVSPLEHRANP